MKCEYCSSDINDNVKFCPNCGAEQNKNKYVIAKVTTNAPSEEPGAGRIALMVLVSLYLALQVVLFFAVVIFRGIPVGEMLKNEIFLIINIMFAFLPALICFLIQLLSGWILVFLALVGITASVLLMIKAPLICKIYSAVLAFLNVVLLVFIFIFAIVWPNDNINNAYIKVTKAYEKEFISELVNTNYEYTEFKEEVLDYRY